MAVLVRSAKYERRARAAKPRGDCSRQNHHATQVTGKASLVFVFVCISLVHETDKL